jgi:hypothetical protein
MKKLFKEYCVLSKTFCPSSITYKYEDEFLDIIGKKVLKVYILLQSPLLTDFTPPPSSKVV